MKLFINLLLIIYLICGVQSDLSVIVQSPFGQIKGIRSTANNNQSYVKFRGIPYALPPVGGLRFAKPVPHPKLKTGEQFDATLQPFACLQNKIYLQPGEEMSEDCLILNIFVKDVNKYQRKPRKVIVFIHGGGFFSGSSLPYQPTSFVTENDIIVVTINYRLGLLGFLSTENEASLGNYGMWDQVLAIKWVKDNIASFGGDPEDVAIVGQSAGSACVSLLSLSPAAKGLFTKVFPITSTATSTYAKYVNAKSDALQAAKSLNCWSGDLDENIDIEQGKTIIECLRTRPATDIIVNALNFSARKLVSPRVDGDFLPGSPSKLLTDDKYLDSIGFYNRSYLTTLNNNVLSAIEDFVGPDRSSLLSRYNLSKVEKTKLWESIKTETFKDHVGRRLDLVDPSPELVSFVEDWYERRFPGDMAFFSFLADTYFNIPTFDWVNALSRRPKTKSWLLYFNHYPRYIKGTERGIVYGVVLSYWLDLPLDIAASFTNATFEGGFDEEDKKLKQIFTPLVVDFITCGNPSKSLKIPGGWPKYSTDGDDYLDFNPYPSIQQKLLREKREFWNNLVPRFVMGSKKECNDRRIKY
ncbi:hypothetical protein Btru_023656 [Bulinus truncatus]|nr:hypothetical protein Btru_023656 [Bulinus truncatus]